MGMQLASRCLLVLLFLPFSALDKLLNYRQAVDQAAIAVTNRTLAGILIMAGFCIEVTMSIAVLSGFADRLAALVLAAYCLLTAVLWKQFWRAADFKLQGASTGRETFWDFLKNLSVAGGFLLLACGSDAAGLDGLLRHPLASSNPYGVVDGTSR